MRSLSALLATLAALAIGAAPASADEPVGPLMLTGLRVSGGETTWHAKNGFRLDWDPAGDEASVAAVHYRVDDEAGEIAIPEERVEGAVNELERLLVPAPGIYTAEVWLEGPDGALGPAATAALRFDDVAPAPARPLGPGGWIAGGEPAVLRIGHPPGPWPISGIRGYAISVDRGSGGAPCKGSARCTAAETDLRGGIGDDTISLGILPEGTSFARVLAVSGSGTRSRTVESTTVRVDGTRPTVELRGVPHGWVDRPVQLTATASDPLSGMAAAGPAGPYTAIAIDDRAPATAAGDSVSTTVRGDGAHQIAFYARDAAGNVADGEAGSAQPSLASVRIDEEPPRAIFARTQDPSEPERIEATVTDALSGSDPARGRIAIRPAGSGQPFEPLPTVVSPGRLVARWDSDSYPPGSYEFRATGYDAAGNSSAVGRRLDGSPMLLSNPLKEPTEIESGFGGGRLLWRRCSGGVGGRRCHHQAIGEFDRRPRARTVPYGRGAVFSGRLTSASGKATGDLPVAVVETFATGADPARRATVVHTRADGSFLVHLAPGPSRRVEAAFAGNNILTRSSGPPARFAVLSSIHLRTSGATAQVGGAPIVFSGRVGETGASIPAGGLPVQLQFRLSGSDWSEFRTVQTNAAGRFRYPYAFSDDDSRSVRFQFRAYLPAQQGWPYEPATSRPILITGR